MTIAQAIRQCEVLAELQGHVVKSGGYIGWCIVCTRYVWTCIATVEPWPACLNTCGSSAPNLNLSSTLIAEIKALSLLPEPGVEP